MTTTAGVWVVPGATLNLLPSYGDGNANPTIGLVLHTTTDDAGSPAHFFADLSHQASSAWFVGNGQGGTVDGGIEQYIDPDQCHAWAQAAGNRLYHSVECEGTVSEPLTRAQIAAVGHILAQGHLRYGWPLQLAEAPGQPGLGVHFMGGLAWGGHTCPDGVPGAGPRSLQRPAIIAAALAEVTGHPSSSTPAPTTAPQELDDMWTLVTTKTADGKSDLWVSLLTEEGSVGLQTKEEERDVARYIQERTHAAGAGGVLTILELGVVNRVLARLRGGYSPEQIAAAVLTAVQAGGLEQLVVAVHQLPADTVAALRDALNAAPPSAPSA